MRAWIITWDSTSESAEVADEIAAVLPSRWSPQRVSDVIEQLYALRNSNLAELASYAKNPKANPYRPHTVDNHADLLSCGDHPYLYARKVSDFKVTRNPEGFECASWREPDRYQLKADKSGIEMAHVGVASSSTRIIQGPLSNEGVWDRSAGRRKAKFVPAAG